MEGGLTRRARFRTQAASSDTAMVGFGLLLHGLLHNRALNAAIRAALVAGALALTSYAYFGGRSRAAPR